VSTHKTSPNFALNLNLESDLPTIFIIDLTQPITLPLPVSTPSELASSKSLPNPNYFLLRRQLCRAFIAHYSGFSADIIQIQKTSTGALEIYPSTGLHISFSYRGSLTAIGISTHPIGVDLEITDNTTNIPWNILHPFERTTIERADTQNRMDIFYQIWTGKEACVKALGTGFIIPPDSFCILPNQINITLNKKNIQLNYKKIDFSHNKIIHISVAQIAPTLKLV
jgi:phosphopantetheinyl transferase